MFEILGHLPFSLFWLQTHYVSNVDLLFPTATLDGTLKANVTSGFSSVYIAREGELDLNSDSGKNYCL